MSLPSGFPNVLVVGSGGREHALAWKLSQSSSLGAGKVFVAPGNAGMPGAFPRLEARDFTELGAEAKKRGVGLAVIGPDNALADGIVDSFEAQGILTFGPSRAAARIEASKAFAKDVMKSAGVPTAKHFAVTSADEALKVLKSVPWGPQAGWVIKADGLALGKGVVVCATFAEASEAARRLIQISGSLVIEQRLFGEEISWMALCDGERCALLEPARDYKRLGDGDQGPNTGGMGAFSPIPGIPDIWADRVRDEVFLPTLRELKRRGCPFKGVLYAGLMADLARDQYWVLEFNARFGDPETQVLLPRINGDFLEWCLAVARGDLSRLPARIPFHKDAAVYVVAAAAGYPEQPEKGRAIRLPESAHVLSAAPAYFLAGVADGAQGLVTSGGRVLGALGRGVTLVAARTEAYTRIGEVGFEGMQFRSDVAGGRS